MKNIFLGILNSFRELSNAPEPFQKKKKMLNLKNGRSSPDSFYYVSKMFEEYLPFLGFCFCFCFNFAFPRGMFPQVHLQIMPLFYP